MMDTPATLQKRPAFSPLDAEARQPTTSVGSISPPRIWRHLTLGLHPPLTNNNGVMLYRKGGRNSQRNCCIPRISPPAFCTKAKVAKGGAYLRDTTVDVNTCPLCGKKCRNGGEKQWIGCDNCPRWFHRELSRHTTQKKWKCQLC